MTDNSEQNVSRETLYPVSMLCRWCGGIIENGVELPFRWEHVVGSDVFCGTEDISTMRVAQPRGQLTYEQLIQYMSRPPSRGMTVLMARTRSN